MPQKTKDQENAKNEEKKVKQTSKATKSTKAKTTKATDKKIKDSKSSTGQKANVSSIEKNLDTDLEKSESKSNSSKSSSLSKSKDTKTSKNKTDSKSAKTKKEVSKKTSKSAKSSTKSPKSKKRSEKLVTGKKSTSKKVKKPEIVEYYDLPYRYNQTVVKILAQTPTNLFIYWDISDEDRENYIREYGENFFETTRPVLIVHNDTLNYSFEVEINDFANSWYLSVADSKCNYRIELGRRPNIKTEKLNKDYIYISSSNEIESPNDRILFDKTHPEQVIYFRNVKSGNTYAKQISDVSFIKSFGKIYNIYDLYKAIYKNENIEEIYDLSNPSSGNPSSGSLSSR